MLPIGLSTSEGIAAGTSAFIESDKHNMGILMCRERGVANRAIAVSSLQEDRKRFGGIVQGQYGAYVMRNLFNNAGGFGATVYGVRVVGAGSKAASIAVTYDSASNQTWTVQNLVSPSALQKAKKAFYPVNPEKGDSFTISGVTFVCTTASIKNVTSGLTAALNADATFSASYKATDKTDYIEIEALLVNVAISVTLAFTHTLTSGTLLTNKIIDSLYTNDGVYISLNFLFERSAGSATALQTLLNSKGIGSWTVAWNAGTNVLTISTTNSTLSIAGSWYYEADYSNFYQFTLVTTNTGGSSTSDVAGTDIAFCTVYAAQQGLDDVGDWANGRLSVIFYPIGVRGHSIMGIDVVFDNEVVEQYSGLTFQAIMDEINSVSYYIRIQDYNAGHYPATKIQATLTGGVYVAPAGEFEFYPVSDSASPRGLACFDGVNVQILANTEYHTSTMALQGRDYAANNRKHYVCVLPQFSNDIQIQSFSQALQTGNSLGSFVSGYNIWVRTNDENGGYTWVPGLGWILGGGFIRVPQSSNDQIWIAPAGLESVVADALEVSPNNLTQAQISLYVRQYTINVPMYRKGTGTFLASSRTFSTNPLFHSIHVRRFTNFILETLEKSLLWVLQKPNSPEVRKELVTQITSLFKTFYDDGGIENSVPFEKAFKIICDKTNNPATQDRKSLNVDIYWIPTECIEAVGIRLNRNDGVLQTEILDLQQAA